MRRGAGGLGRAVSATARRESCDFWDTTVCFGHEARILPFSSNVSAVITSETRGSAVAILIRFL